MADRLPARDRVALDLLRPALELAFYLAKAEAGQRPPVEPPPSMRPYMKFRRLTGPALAAVRVALDDDPEFRARAVDRARGDDGLGPAGPLFLERPEGWEAAMESLVDDALAALESEAEQRQIDVLEEQLTKIERARSAAQDRVEELVADRDAARRSRDDERRRRSSADERLRHLEQRISELTERAVAAETRATEAQTSLGAERQRSRELRAELDRRDADTGAGRATANDDRRDAGTGTPPDEPPPSVAAPVIDPAAAADLLDRAAAATNQLTEALEGLSRLARDADDPEPADSDAAAERPQDAPRRRARRRRRRPVRLPGLAEDDPAAAAWLLRHDGAAVLVDGYNVTLRAWPESELTVQRAHLLDLLTTEVTRSGADVLVVFDGEDRSVSESLPPRCPVRVEFTPADLEADDRILDLVDALPPDRPVVVVSSDHRVRDGARKRGANTISSDQLIAVLRGR